MNVVFPFSYAPRFFKLGAYFCTPQDLSIGASQKFVFNFLLSWGLFYLHSTRPSGIRVIYIAIVFQ